MPRPSLPLVLPVFPIKKASFWVAKQSFSRRSGAPGSANQPAGLLGRKSSFRSKSKAIWFKILIKAAMFISYIRLYFLITVPKENLGRRRGEGAFPFEATAFVCTFK